MKPIDPIPSILKYIYSNQDPECLTQEDLNDSTCLSIFSMAHILDIHSLLEISGKYIAESMLKAENSAAILSEAVKFESESLHAAASQCLINHFSEIIAKSTNMEMVIELPVDIFIEICSSDYLAVTNEDIVYNVVCKYLERRASIPEPKKEEEVKAADGKEEGKEGEKPKGEEGDAKKEGAEGDAEKKEAEGEGDKKEAEGEKKGDEKKKDEGAKPAEKELSVYEKAEKRMEVRILTPEETRQVIQTVRFSWMPHDELLKAASNSLLMASNDLVMEGLSVRLNKFEQSTVGAKNINISARKLYPGFVDGAIKGETEIRAESHRPHYTESHHPGQSRGFQHAGHEGARLTHGNQGSNPELHAGMEMATDPTAMMSKTAGVQGSRVSPGYKSYNFTGGNDPRVFDDPNFRHSMPSFNPTATMMMNSPSPGKNFVRQPQYSEMNKIGVDSTVNLSIANRHIEFNYQYDFDDNGALYYLGSHGKRKVWQNPHIIGEVQGFASSVGFGKLEDLLGRTATNLRSCNEENSFFGVDLGQGRTVLPTCYTLRNRNSSSHVLMNWQLEASNDKSRWMVLDRRVHLTGDPDQDLHMEADRAALKKKGSTSTWGVDNEVFKKLDANTGANGFRYFRIVQVGRNSSGSDNLTLSGLELYGTVTGGTWP